jgi:hypothetical protein
MIFVLHLSIPVRINPMETNEALSDRQALSTLQQPRSVKYVLPGRTNALLHSSIPLIPNPALCACTLVLCTDAQVYEDRANGTIYFYFKSVRVFEMLQDFFSLIQHFKQQWAIHAN